MILKFAKREKNSSIKVIAIQDGEIVGILPRIRGIVTECDCRLFEDIFDCKNIVDIVDYEKLDQFIEKVFIMTEDYIEDNATDVMITFIDNETNQEFVGIHSYVDYDEELDDGFIAYHIMSLNDEEETYDENDKDCQECMPYFEFYEVDEEE